MDSQTLYPNTIVTSAYPTTPTVDWANPTDVKAYDGHYASVTRTGAMGSSYSYYLDCTNFGFYIPTGAIIYGIRVSPYWKDTSTDGAYTSDWEARIIKGGVVGSVNKAISYNLPKTLIDYSYGNSTDLWDLSWTAADINASNFGCRLVLRLYTSGNTAIANIDYILISIWYTIADISVAITGRSATASKGTPSRSGSATFGLTGVGTTAAYADSAPLGTAGVSLTGRSAGASAGTTFASAPGAGMFTWNWTYGVDADWHEVLGSLMPESEATISGVGVASSLGTPTSVTDGQISLSGVQVSAACNFGLGLAYAEVFITGLGVTSAVEHVSPAAHGDVNVPTVGRYATASIGTLIAAGTSVSFASGVWLLYPVTIFVEQQWQCDIEVSEVHNV